MRYCRQITEEILQTHNRGDTADSRHTPVEILQAKETLETADDRNTEGICCTIFC